jgi:hypothetical protein
MNKNRVFTYSRLEYLIAGILFFLLTYFSMPFMNLSEYTNTPLIDPAGILQVYPWLHHNIREVSNGHFPLWNQYTGLGEPHIANIQSAFFFPYFWPWLVKPIEGIYGFLIVGKLWLSAIFWFAFTRKKLCSFPGAVVAGAAYGFSGYSLWFLQLLDMNSQILLPLLMLCLSRLVNKRDLVSFIASAFLICLAILGGHPEASFITVLIATLYAICAYFFESGKNLVPSDMNILRFPFKKTPVFSTPALIISAVGGVSLLLTLVSLLPFANYLSRCWTIHGSGFGFFHLDPRAIFNMFLPWIHVVINNMPTVIPVEYINHGALEMALLPYRETAVPGNLPGAGLCVCGLALAAIIGARRLGWPVLFFSGLLFVLLGLTLGLPGFRYIAFVPPFNMNSNFKFFFSEINACLAVLAGVGLDILWIYFSKTMIKRKKLFVLALLGTIPAIFIFALFMYGLNIPEYSRALLLSYLIILFMYFSAYIFFIGLLLTARIAKPENGRYLEFGKKVGHWPVVILFLSFLTVNGRFIAPYVEIEKPDGEVKKQILEKLDEMPGKEARTTGLENYWPANLNMIDGVKDVRSSDALFYKPYINALNEVNGFNAEQSLGYFYPSYFTRPSPDRLFTDRARNLSAKAAITTHKLYKNLIIDHLVLKESGKYHFSPPMREEVSSISFSTDNGKDISSYKLPGLFIHAPASVNFSPHPDFIKAKTKSSKQSISFIPYLKSPDKKPQSDGVIFQLLIKNNGAPELGYSRFILPKEVVIKSPEKPVTVLTQGADEIQLSVLSGVRGDSSCDYSNFAAISFHPDGFEPPPEPFWAYSEEGPYIYELPHKPWAHLQEQHKDLLINRSANDKVAIILDVKESGNLIVHEAWYPGWRAFSKTGNMKIDIPEDKASWRVPFEKDTESITFIFTPIDFRIGLFVTLSTILVSLILLVYNNVIKRNKGETD